ncbi:hypothetical protein [Burkholderia vietnamiensis]|uniref:hypothetical protein n=1 Tax=Burkholderia vietnamiensis TaxID=60552 RepID=UPI0012DA1873|nr:hypothetical protein [Burkholderia vietnamiensis]
MWSMAAGSSKGGARLSGAGSSVVQRCYLKMAAGFSAWPHARRSAGCAVGGMHHARRDARCRTRQYFFLSFKFLFVIIQSIPRAIKLLRENQKK